MPGVRLQVRAAYPGGHYRQEVLKALLIDAAQRARAALEARSLFTREHWAAIERGGLGLPLPEAVERFNAALRYLQIGSETGDPRYLRWARAEFTASVTADPGACDAYLGLCLLQGVDGLVVDPMQLIRAVAFTSERINELQEPSGVAFDVRWTPLIEQTVRVASSADARLWYAVELAKKGQLKEADHWLDSVTRHNARYLAARAKRHFLNREDDQALLFLPGAGNAIELRAESLWLQGMSLLRLERAADAVDMFARAFQASEDDAMRLNILYSLALAEQESGDELGAGETLRVLYQHDPQFSDLRELLGRPEEHLTPEQQEIWARIVASFESDAIADDETIGDNQPGSELP